jgi:hypothetical protein
LRRRIFVTALDLSPMESFRVECLSSTPSPALQEAGLFLDDGAKLMGFSDIRKVSLCIGTENI